MTTTMTMKLTFTAVVGLLSVVLYPYRLTVLHLITGSYYVRTDCGGDPTVAPKLNLKPVRSCDVVNMAEEPCVMRNVVTGEQIAQFIEENGNQKFVLKKIVPNEVNGTTSIGNPIARAYILSEFDRQYCSMNDFLRRDERCREYHDGFKSLNFSSYLPLSGPLLDISAYSRTDTFLGYASQDKVTAGFHSNSFEESQSLQLVGEKVWLLMNPKDMNGLMGAYTMGGFNAIWNTCVQDLEQVELQAVHIKPGDVVTFPKAWGHQVYTREGPNVMITFRNHKANPFLNLRDAVATISGAIDYYRAHYIWHRPYLSTKYCPTEGKTPSNFARGHPREKVGLSKSAQYMRDYDMRCADLINPMVKDHNIRLSEVVPLNQNIDNDIYEQVLSFLSVD